MELPLKELMKICKKYKIELMIIFGSFISNHFNQKSDIDLAIIARDLEIIKDNRMIILNKLGALFKHREIDLVLLNHADPLLKFNIASEGKLIYEEKTGLFNKFMVRAMSEHNDAKKFYELEKKYIKNFLERGENYGQQRISPPQTK